MKLCIAGSRDLDINPLMIGEFLKSFNIDVDKIREVISGGARGIDTAGEYYVKLVNETVPLAIVSSYKGRDSKIVIKVFEADWEEHGKAAGPIRNKQMAEHSDAVLLIWDGESKGSANCRAEFEKLNKPIYEVILRKV